MSTTAVVDRAAVNVKHRRVWSVVLLTVVTFGIYGVVWYYRINRELRDFGAAHGDAELGASRPWRSVVAVTIGAIVVVPRLISLLRLTRRVQAAERIAFGQARPVTMELAALLASLCFSLIALVSDVGFGAQLASWASFLLAMGAIQSRLNAAWHAAAIPAENHPLTPPGGTLTRPGTDIVTPAASGGVAW
jgi:Domain of unknown function (DUF4234)